MRELALEEVFPRVAEIVGDVRTRGDEALLDWTEQLDGERPASLRVSDEDLACSRGEPETAYASSKTVRSAVVEQGSAATSVKGAALRLVLAPTGNAARYRVREQLVGHDLPNDAVGETQKLTGAISIDSNGKLIRDASKFTVDAGSFVSDKDRRDGFVRGRLLGADEYPTIVFVPTHQGVGQPSGCLTARDRRREARSPPAGDRNVPGA